MILERVYNFPTASNTSWFTGLTEPLNLALLVAMATVTWFLLTAHAPRIVVVIVLVSFLGLPTIYVNDIDVYLGRRGGRDHRLKERVRKPFLVVSVQELESKHSQYIEFNIKYSGRHYLGCRPLSTYVNIEILNVIHLMTPCDAKRVSSTPSIQCLL